MLCKKCIKQIFENLREYGYEEDLLILKALNKKGSLNMEQISLYTQKTVSERRDSLSRLLGSSLIKGERVGSSKIFSISDSGQELIKMIKINELED